MADPPHRELSAALDRPVRVLVRQLDPAASLPRYARSGDAGADLVTTVAVSLQPGERALVPTGLAIALPDGYAGFVHPRSGLAARVGLGLVNSPGTIDSGYRGEIKLVLVNLDPVQPLHLAAGDRVAQLVIQRVERAQFVSVDRLPESERGDGGHGSTGGAAPLHRQRSSPSPLPNPDPVEKQIADTTAAEPRPQES